MAAGVPVLVIRVDYSTNNVGTGAYVQLTSSLFQTVTEIDIYDSSGRVLKLAEGGAGSEIDLPFYITPGGTNGLVPLYIPQGTRVSIRAIDGTANSGQIIINGYA